MYNRISYQFDRGHEFDEHKIFHPEIKTIIYTFDSALTRSQSYKRNFVLKKTKSVLNFLTVLYLNL